MSKITQGRRIYPETDGYLDPEKINQPACYGKATAPKSGSAAGWWQVTAPDGSIGSISPKIHTVTEHEDGTITLSPSLDFSQRKPGAWHGWLERGIFRSI